MSYVNISDFGLQSNLEQPANETIKWVVFYEAYPKPQITWSKGSRENIIRNTSSKYVIKDELKRTVLEIKEIGLADSGQYLLTVRTNRVEDTRNFTLRVKGNYYQGSCKLFQLSLKCVCRLIYRQTNGEGSLRFTK